MNVLVRRPRLAVLMRFSMAAVVLLSTLTSCIPLRQESRVSGPSHPSVLLCDDRYLLVGVDLHRERIVPSGSYVVSPCQTRYEIQVEPHQFDINQKFDVLRAEVYLYDTDGKELQRWSNGEWSFHFVVEGELDVRTIDQRWKYWTFYYNPLIHGPPN